MRRRAFVGLGSNLDDPARQLRRALDALAALPDTTLHASSRFYRSPPWGPIAQPDFVNAVAALDTGLAPPALMEALLGIEREAGRQRRERWGPRVLDLDLLLYDGLEWASDTLQLPHPRMHERPFVLLPLAELAPDLELPGLGSLRQLIQSVDRSSVEAIG
jgi:2-amino-4-hydroxy-6-hydroxymethyldihydropteridine diphosphokinase